MAKSKQTPSKEGGHVIEATITINPRGRSVVHGTLLISGDVKTFRHELLPSERSDVEELILSVFMIVPDQPT